jgi:hypothetical protein
MRVIERARWGKAVWRKRSTLSYRPSWAQLERHHSGFLLWAPGAGPLVRHQRLPPHRRGIHLIPTKSALTCATTWGRCTCRWVAAGGLAIHACAQDGGVPHTCAVLIQAWLSKFLARIGASWWEIGYAGRRRATYMYSFDSGLVSHQRSWLVPLIRQISSQSNNQYCTQQGFPLQG